MWIKVCGLRTADRTRQLARFDGLSALGLNRYKPSPRYLSRKRTRELARIIRRINSDLEIALVYVEAPVDRVQEDIKEIEPDIVQLHGDESPEYLRKLRTAPVRLVKAFRVREGFDPAQLARYDCWAYLLDAYRPGEYGGTGEQAPWEEISQWEVDAPLILAGGLNPDNVRAAVRSVDPWGLDVCSGVESETKKDVDAVRKLLGELDSEAVDT